MNVIIMYNGFEIEFISGDESVKPTVLMSTELNADPFNNDYHTESLRLEFDTTEDRAIETAKRWIDQFWEEENNAQMPSKV